MEKFGLKQNFDSVSEREPLDIERGIKRERTFLGKFHGRAKDIARVLLFVSALSAGAVGVKEAQASEENIKPFVQSEQMQPEQYREQLRYLQEIKDSRVNLLLRAQVLDEIIADVLKKHQERAEYQMPAAKMHKVEKGLQDLLQRMSEVRKQLREINKQIQGLKSGDIERTSAAMKNIEEADAILNDVAQKFGPLMEQSYD